MCIRDSNLGRLAVGSMITLGVDGNTCYDNNINNGDVIITLYAHSVFLFLLRWNKTGLSGNILHIGRGSMYCV